MSSQLPKSDFSFPKSLAPELLAAIVSYLPNRNLKSLRLTCKALGEKTPLHFDRIFLSANPRNIEVARGVADHEKFRHEVKEIIWDDALFVHEIVRPNEQYLLLADDPDMEDADGGLPAWFVRACNQSLQLKNIKGLDLSFSESWDYYQEILKQQEEVLASGADIHVLKYALERFPSLRRITITPAAHGKLNAPPLYDMPMIRNFPKGFNYPTPQAWPPTGLERSELYFVPPWNDETSKKPWRGFCIVTNELARQNDHHVSELIVDVKELETGLSCRIFESPCEEYDNLVQLFRRPGFSRIDLALLADGQYYDENWSSFRSGYLKQAIEAASELQHLSLRITADYDQIDRNDLAEHCIPLRTIFPVEKWQKLQHFGLSNLLVKGPDLLSLLTELPITLRSIELSFLTIIEGNYHNLLNDIRNTLGWRDRAIDERPKMIIHVHQSAHTRYYPLRYRCVDSETNGFIYDDEVNPFKAQSNRPLDDVGVERFQLGYCYSE